MATEDLLEAVSFALIGFGMVLLGYAMSDAEDDASERDALGGDAARRAAW